MKKTKAEIIADLTAFIGENQSDDAVALIENVSDSIDDNTDELRQENARLQKQYEDNDKAWRQKYIDRFNNEDNKDDKDSEVIDVDDSDKPLTYENLFEEG